MTTGTDLALTPFEDSFYAADWRYRAAAACVETPGTRPATAEALRDSVVREAIGHLKALQTRGATCRGERARFSRVLRWAQDGPHRHTGHVIEALLLTTAPMDALAADMGCAVEDVRLYERLFFAVRDGDGAMVLAPAQLQFFATEGSFKPVQQRPEHLMWRRVAVSAGYRALVQILELGAGFWAAAPHVDLVQVTTTMAHADTLAKLAAGALRTDDLMKLESMRIKDKLVRHTTGEFKKRDEGMELVIQLLQLFAPRMRTAAEAQHALAIAAAENVRQADKAISETEIEDHGIEVGNAELERLLKKSAGELARACNRQQAEAEAKP